jgi:hypothetical protein
MRVDGRRFAPCLLCTLASCAATSQTVPPFKRACGVCINHPESTEAFDPDSFLGARFLSFRGGLDTHVTWTDGEPHIRTGPTVDLAPFFDRTGSARWLLSTGMAFGAWGDQQHGDFIWQSATGPRVHLFGDPTLLDGYLLVTEGILAGWGNLAPGRGSEFGNIAGAGLGLNVFRAFSVEVAGHWVYAFDSPFRPDNGGHSTRSIPDVGIALSLDFCAFGSFCNRTPRAQQSVDGTCEVYKAANRMCSAAETTQGGRQQLCEQALSALLVRESPSPPLARDSFRTFLDNLSRAEASTPLAAPATALSQTDTCLVDWGSCGRQAECLLAQQGQEAETHRIYSPYAVEALGALGCQPNGTILAGKCSDYKCEDPGPTPAVCSAH